MFSARAARISTFGRRAFSGGHNQEEHIAISNTWKQVRAPIAACLAQPLAFFLRGGARGAGGLFTAKGAPRADAFEKPAHVLRSSRVGHLVRVQCCRAPEPPPRARGQAALPVRTVLPRRLTRTCKKKQLREEAAQEGLRSRCIISALTRLGSTRGLRTRATSLTSALLACARG